MGGEEGVRDTEEWCSTIEHKGSVERPPRSEYIGGTGKEKKNSAAYRRNADRNLYGTDVYPALGEVHFLLLINAFISYWLVLIQ